MCPQLSNLFSVAILLTFLTNVSVHAADQVVLQFNPAGSQGAVSLHSTLGLPVSSMYPEYTILRSTNMQTWEPVVGPVSGGVGVSDELLRCAVPLAGKQAFYRVVANVKTTSPNSSRLGDAIYGYGTEFGRQIQQVGQLPLADFVSRYTPTNQYLQHISFDPTTVEFWNQFILQGVHRRSPGVLLVRCRAARLAPFLWCHAGGTGGNLSGSDASVGAHRNGWTGINPLVSGRRNRRGERSIGRGLFSGRGTFAHHGHK